MSRFSLQFSPENLKRLRADLGMSQSQVANLLHVSGFARVSDWERGKYCMESGLWELLLIKTGKHPRFKDVKPEEPAA